MTCLYAMCRFNFLKFITGRCPVSFLATKKSLLRNWSFEGYTNFIACCSTFFLTPGLQESVPPVSFELLKGKKIEWVLVVRVFDIPELPSKWKNHLSVSSSFSEKTLRRPAAGRFSKFPNVNKVFMDGEFEEIFLEIVFSSSGIIWQE